MKCTRDAVHRFDGDEDEEEEGEDYNSPLFTADDSKTAEKTSDKPSDVARKRKRRPSSDQDEDEDEDEDESETDDDVKDESLEAFFAQAREDALQRSKSFSIHKTSSTGESSQNWQYFALFSSCYGQLNLYFPLFVHNRIYNSVADYNSSSRGGSGKPL